MSSAHIRSYLPSIVAGLLAMSLLSGCAGAQADTINPALLNPLTGKTFFLQRDTPAAQQVRTWRTEGRTADADQIEKIARQPAAIWLSGDPRWVEGQVRDLTNQARAAHQTPVFVAYNIPHRDCGNYSAGGAPDSAAYTAWIDNLARGLDGDAIIILEPDAIPHALAGCLDDQQRAQRYQQLHAAVDTLVARGALVYLDAGHDGWITNTALLAGALRQSGIDSAAGFSLNVSFFDTTAATRRYGIDLSERLGGAHFVIDTSRNGAGPATTNTDGAPAWCNPPGRALGTPPTAATGQTRVDAYLWIKNPGDSDGACHPGAPPAGQWWPDYALDLARHTP
jgi:endoglucanase